MRRAVLIMPRSLANKTPRLSDCAHRHAAATEWRPGGRGRPGLGPKLRLRQTESVILAPATRTRSPGAETRARLTVAPRPDTHGTCKSRRSNTTVESRRPGRAGAGPLSNRDGSAAGPGRTALSGPPSSGGPGGGPGVSMAAAAGAPPGAAAPGRRRDFESDGLAASARSRDSAG